MKRILLAFGSYIFWVASMMVVPNPQSPVPTDYFQLFNPVTYVKIFFIDFLFIVMPIIIPGVLLVVLIEQIFYVLVRGYDSKICRLTHNVLGVVLLLYIYVYSYSQVFTVSRDFILYFVWLKDISLAAVFFLLTRALGSFVVEDTRFKRSNKNSKNELVRKFFVRESN